MHPMHWACICKYHTSADQPAQRDWVSVGQVAVEQVKPPPEQPEVYQGVIARKRKRVDEATEVGEMPKVRWCSEPLPAAPEPRTST